MKKLVSRNADSVWVSFPLTETKGKARLKRRSSVSEDGETFRPTQDNLTQHDYIEWQIGYSIDLTINDQHRRVVHQGADYTTLGDRQFNDSNGNVKLGYELTEIVYHALQLNYLTIQEINETRSQVAAIEDRDTLDRLVEMQPYRQGGTATRINGVDFLEFNWVRPMRVRHFDDYDILVEVSKDRRQAGSGLQMMLYLCIPLTLLEFNDCAIGRPAHTREVAKWNIGQKEAQLSLELFRIFGMMSPAHRDDVLAIFDKVLIGDREE